MSAGVLNRGWFTAAGGGGGGDGGEASRSSMVRRLYGGRVVCPFGWLLTASCVALSGSVTRAGFVTGAGGSGGGGAEGFSLQMSLLQWSELSCSLHAGLTTMDSRVMDCTYRRGMMG